VVAAQATLENVSVSAAEVETRLSDFKKQLGTNSNAYTAWLNQYYISDADERAELKQTILFEKMQAKHSEGVSDKAEQVHVRFILLATEREATDIYNRLKSGNDFATLAKQFSLDPGTAAQGGDFGYIWPGSSDPTFEKTAYALQTNQISTPFKTALGWNVIQSLGKETRSLPFDEVQQRKADAFAAYIKALRDQAKIEILIKP
jgi:parvulin-like peptidyl-prolyl isomerase